MSNFKGFPKDTIAFLSELSKNNTREWFAVNKSRFEQSVQASALGFIEAMYKPLEKIAPVLKVEAKKSGGSLMRIYKDTRFSKDKTPYKTNVGIQFRHEAGKDVHAPGVYFHIDPAEIFFGAGMWRPDGPSLKAIRDSIVEHPDEWKKVKTNNKIRESFTWYEDRLSRPPRGYDKEHVYIDDLRQKSFLISATLTRKQIESPDILELIPKLTKSAAPLMAFLCRAVGQPY